MRVRSLGILGWVGHRFSCRRSCRPAHCQDSSRSRDCSAENVLVSRTAKSQTVDVSAEDLRSSVEPSGRQPPAEARSDSERLPKAAALSGVRAVLYPWVEAHGSPKTQLRSNAKLQGYERLWTVSVVGSVSFALRPAGTRARAARDVRRPT